MYQIYGYEYQRNLVKVSFKLHNNTILVAFINKMHFLQQVKSWSLCENNLKQTGPYIHLPLHLYKLTTIVHIYQCLVLLHLLIYNLCDLILKNCGIIVPFYDDLLNHLTMGII